MRSLTPRKMGYTMSPAANDVVVCKVDMRGVQYVLHEGAPTCRRHLLVTAGLLH